MRIIDLKSSRTDVRQRASWRSVRHLIKSESLSKSRVVPGCYCRFSFDETMVNAEKGVLIECDPQMKQFLLHLDDTKAVNGQKFIIQDLDATHLFVDLTMITELKRQIDDLMERINFVEG